MSKYNSLSPCPFCGHEVVLEEFEVATFFLARILIVILLYI